MPSLADKAADQASGATVSGLSQLLARILSQLSLSAWLPSAALVLLTVFVFRLSDVVDAHSSAVLRATQESRRAPTLTFVDAVTEAVKRVGQITVRELILLFVVVVVLTLLTQAFAFESIRFLEGYWNPWFAIEWFATACCAYYRFRLTILRWRQQNLIEQAWRNAELDMYRSQVVVGASARQLTPKLIKALAYQVTLKGQEVKVSEEEQAILDRVKWREDAPGDLIRRLKNVEKRLSDYPSVSNVQPTRLGNVLRHYEEETGVDDVESLVDRVFDRLPFPLQLQHDEQRGRLDVYCSMVFVWIFIAGLAAIQIGMGTNRHYALCLIAVALIAGYLTYRAAVASARYYGSLLQILATYLPEPEPTEEADPASNPLWRRLISCVWARASSPSPADAVDTEVGSRPS